MDNLLLRRRAIAPKLNISSGQLPLTIKGRRMPLKELNRYGLCEQDGTPTPSSPVDIVCNNGAIKFSPNMANVNEQTALVGYYTSSQGVVTADIYNWMYKDFIPVKPNTTYTLSMSQSVYFVSISEYRTAADSGFVVRKTGSTGSNTSLTITTGANTNFIRFGTNVDRTVVTLEEVLGINWMLNLGDTAMPYQPYCEGGIYAGGTHPGKNLYNPASSWLTHMPTGFSGNSASWPNSAPDTDPNSITYFMRVKPNTTYTYSCATAGDRFGVAGKNSVVDPSSYDTSNKLVFDSVLVPLIGYSDVRYSFTTGANTQMIAVYCALNTAPTDIQIEEGATATAYEPYTEIPYLPEVLTVCGQNLVDLTAVTDGYYYDPSGVYTSIAVARLTDYISVKAGQTYTVYVKAQRVGTAANVRCNLFNSAKEWKSQSSFVVNSGAAAVSTITPIENGFLRVSANYAGTGAKVDWSTLQIVAGEYTLATMPPYQPYTAQTANVEALLGVGTYKDTQEVVSGLIGRKMGVKVFDGTETFTASSSGAMVTTIDDVAIGAENTPMNTHFALETSPTSVAVGTQRFGANGTKIYSKNYYMKHTSITTTADFKAWLAAQYTAGTPVIVIYPLATPTSEQVQGQALYANKGANTVESQANVSPVDAEIKYYK